MTALQILGTGLFEVDPALASDPDYVARVEFATNNIWRRLYLDPPARRGNIEFDPPPFSAGVAAAAGVLGSQLVNSDGLRSFSSRRTAVDVLKAMQSSFGLDALVDARATIAASVPGLTGDTLNQTNDLLKRIDKALDSYFTNP